MSVRAVLVAVAALAAVAPSPAEACSCVQPSITAAWHEYSDTFQGRVLAERIQGRSRWYVVQVQRTFGGCTEAGDLVLVESPVSEASCGQRLTVGTSWLLTVEAQPSGSHFHLGLCGYSRRWATLADDEVDFLLSRPVACDATSPVVCGDGSAPVQCFANSCEVEAWCDEATLCEFNSCGGCVAEFYDDRWAPVCP
jgi:hypothetical protein